MALAEEVSVPSSPFLGGPHEWVLRRRRRRKLVGDPNSQASSFPWRAQMRNNDDVVDAVMPEKLRQLAESQKTISRKFAANRYAPAPLILGAVYRKGVDGRCKEPVSARLIPKSKACSAQTHTQAKQGEVLASRAARNNARMKDNVRALFSFRPAGLCMRA